jgi:hypothetical protein
MKVLVLFMTVFTTILSYGQAVFEIETPESIKGFYTIGLGDSTINSFWENGSIAKKAVTANLALVDKGDDSLAINALKTDFTGKIAVLYRGSQSFQAKALFAQNAGALAVIIINNDKANPDAALGMTASTKTGVTIPAISISLNSGIKISNVLRSGETVTGYIGGKKANKNDIKLDVNFALTPARLTNVTALVQQDDVVDSLGIVVINNGSETQDSILCEVLIKFGADTLHHDFKGVIYRDSVLDINGIKVDSILTTINPGKSIGYITFEPFKNKENLKPGKYTLTYSAFSTIKGKEDQFKTDNTITIPFVINDTIYSPVSIENWNQYLFKDTVRDNNGKPKLPITFIYDTIRHKNVPFFTSFFQPSVTFTSYGQCLVFRDANASRIKGTGMTFVPWLYNATTEKEVPLKDEPFKINVFEWADNFSGFADTLKFNNLIPLVSDQIFVSQNTRSWGYENVKFDDEVLFENDKRYLVCVQSSSPNVRFAFDTLTTSLDARTRFYDQPLNMTIRDGSYKSVGFGLDKIPSITLNVKERTSSIGELEDTKNNVIVYPNPANTFVNVSYKLTSTAQPVEVSVTDITGKVVYFSKVVNSSVGTNVFGFDTETFNDGIYVVKVSSNEGNSTRKLSIQK